MLSCFDVASYFLSLSDPDEGDLVSNLKLQKLVYYAQGFYLALHGKPLFGEPIEAWMHGPVVPALWQRYRKHGMDAIPATKNFDPTIIPKKTRAFLDEIWRVYGQFSAWKLRAMTHNHGPWKSTPQSAVISHSALKTFFATKLE